MESVKVLGFAEARASEIACLMEDINFRKEKTAFQSLPPHMRRRAASHNPKRVPRKLREAYLIQNPHATSKPKKAPKKMRKKQQKKKHEKQAKNYPEEYASRSRPGGIWLETHIWHAKRCRMDDVWGYKLPIHCNDKKLGGTHQAATKHAMLQDLSYYGCIELEGPENEILNQLSSLIDPNTGSQFKSEMYIYGNREGHTFLYHPKKFPYGGIGLVTFIWKPITRVSPTVVRKLWIWCHPTFYDELVVVLVAIFQFKEIIAKKEVSESQHDPDVKEFDEIKFASKVNFEKTKQHFNRNIIYENAGIRMFLLKDKLVRFRLTGPDAQLVITKVLAMADIGENKTASDSSSNKCKGIVQTSKNMLGIESPKNDAVVSEKYNSEDEVCHVEKKIKLNLTSESCPKKRDFNTHRESETTEESSVKKVKLEEKKDEQPTRGGSVLWWKCYYDSRSSRSAHENKKKLLEILRSGQSSYSINSNTVFGFTVRDPRLILSVDKRKSVIIRDELDIRQFFNEELDCEMADSPIWDTNIRNEVTATQIPESEINKERSKYVISSESLNLGDKESRVPIFLIQQPGVNGIGSGWDLIAPLGWGMAFWIPLVLNGGRVTGLRDLHFVNFEIGKPSFPISYPDSQAGAIFEEKQRVEELTTYYKRPKAKRPNFTTFGIPNPFFMPWKVLVNDWLGQLRQEKNILFHPDPANGDEAEYAGQETNFFVLRQKEIRLLQNLCVQLSKLKKNKPNCSDKMDNLVNMFDELVKSSLISHRDNLNSLILIRLKCLTRGCPTAHSGIYALNECDVEEVKTNPNFLGPMEPNHNRKCESKNSSSPISKNKRPCEACARAECISTGKCSFAKDSQSSPTKAQSPSARESTAEIQISSRKNSQSSPTTNDQSPSSKDSPAAATKQSQPSKLPPSAKKSECCQVDPKDLERPQVQTLIPSASRKIVGYLSEGGFSSIQGKGSGIGHCSFVGLMLTLKRCIEDQIPPLFFIREQHSFQYRVSLLEIIPNYL